ncbi:putative ketose-bisphosphate aldolase [Arthrobacter globiformis NBRC 12137]|uniref:Putative ketose-bisphosphate aldolase n=1 Tax=Arthrobacter globiformis (strain ATCC 8010 / DSM 20124 / JCM 1332 / NBRC 12137 / NCIMB 8907 / NRRL B-2979 / 168) TaxID=1077972 RepID=H0QLU7_ARTG1|nr:class II fructose-bisphosphate aldolase [Arthrobacter globiformis]GAB13798.1 putative ketose-bisphosphate aldolase [Arthrobacter globiformis NBRC 12137]
MSLTDLKSIAADCARTSTGLGAFNVVHLETARILVEAAEHARRPIVLQISENAVKYHGALEPIGLATLAVARKASVPVAVHLDHAESVELIHEAVDLGFSSVMYDGSKLPYEANREATADVVRHCRAQGVSVEAELGEVGGKNGVHDPSARTDPDEAALFVAQTGVDLLAVAVGSSHAMVSRDAAIDTALVQRIHAAVPVPLVLHGSSGVSDEGMRAAIASGITKVNVSTHLTGIFTGAVRDFLEGHPAAVDSRKYFQEGNRRVEGEVERLLSLYAHAA